ncbi:MAG: hypothetical protein KDK76_07440 [Chlamydiia bacterium]|nr:hypothetical protein [Chlamydiia bacterium]
MIVAIGIALLSLLLIYLEFFVPGGVLGVIGGIGFVFSFIFYAWMAGSYWSSLIFILIMTTLLVLMVQLARWKMKRKSSLLARKELIGAEGEALTDLNPSGHVMAQGKSYKAVSQSGYIKKGEGVKVIGGKGTRLICIRAIP